MTQSLLQPAFALFRTTLTDTQYSVLVSVVSVVVLAVVFTLLLLRRSAAAAARALRASDEMFRILADAAPVMIWTANAAQECTWVNRRWVDFVGRPLPAHLGSGRFDFVHPEDVQRCCDAYLSHCRRRESFLIDYRLRRHDGEYHWIRDNGVPLFDAAGQLRGYAGSCIDISDLMQVEQQLRQTTRTLEALVNTSPLAIVCFDRDGIVRIWNPAAERIFGWSAREAVGQRIPSIPAAGWETFRESMQLALERGRVGPIETSRRRKDGSAIHIESWLSALREFDASGDLFISVVADATDRRRTQDAVRTAMQAAEAASRAKDHFLAVLSHELRTPLTPVLATVSALSRRDGLPVELSEDIELIRRNILVEARLIDDLLDLTRIASGKLSLNLERVDVRALLQEAVATVRPDADERGVELAVELGPDRAIVDGDPTRLRQIIWNLLRNGIKFTPRGGRVRLHAARLPYDRLLIEVSDTGAGMAPELIPRLFHPFEQGGAEVTRAFGGLGLGLAIGRGLAEAMGGVLTGYSDGVGHGSCFSLELPLTVGGVEPAPAPATTPPAEADGQRALRILLVEDHPDTLKVMSRLLSLQHRVTTAQSVQTALDVAGADGFDLVISDLGLPDGSGLDLMRQLRERYRLPGIALSGYGTEQDVRDSRAAGFAAHLTKPVDLTDLRRAIQRVAV